MDRKSDNANDWIRFLVEINWLGHLFGLNESKGQKRTGKTIIE